MNSDSKISLFLKNAFALCKHIKKNENFVWFRKHVVLYLLFFFNLLFFSVPSKVYLMEDITVVEGENRTLTCNVSGSPVQTVIWTEVRSSNQSKGVMLYLTNINRNNAGEYKCEATNDCGDSSASTFLTVLCK